MSTYTNGVYDLPVDAARKEFRGGLGRHQQLGEHAQIVISNSLKDVSMQLTRDNTSFYDVYRVGIKFTDPKGELLPTQIFQHTMDRDVLTKRSDQHAFIVILYEKALRAAAADGVLVAKLCLLWADVIQGYSDFGTTSRKFNPEVWSSKILAAYTDDLVLNSLVTDNTNVK